MNARLRHFIRLVILLLTVAFGRAQTVESDLTKIAGQPDQSQAFSTLDPEAQKEILQHFRGQLQQTDDATKSTAAGFLLRANDDAAAIQLVHEYRAGSPFAERILTREAREVVVSILAKELINDPTETRVFGDVIKPSLQTTSVLIAAGAIARSPAFPIDTCAWARQGVALIHQNHSRADEFVSQFHLWWERNRGAVLAYRYAEATWLPEAALPEEKRLPLALSPAEAPPPVPHSSEPSALSPAAEPSPTPPPSDSAWLALVACAIAGVAGAAALLLFRKRLVAPPPRKYPRA